MKFYKPYKSTQEARNYFIAVTISALVYFVFDYSYEFNILYAKTLKIAPFLCTISGCPAVIMTFWALAKFSNGIANWFKYLAELVIDTMATVICFAAKNPYAQNWNENYFIFVALTLFILRIFLCKKEFKN